MIAIGGVKALFAAVCFVLFFAVAAATVVGLGALGVWLLTHLVALRNGRAMVFLALAAIASLIAAAIVVWSVLPRIDRFTPPGPELTEEQQPALFAEIRAVAAAAKQKMPSHVYLVLDCNAFVTERGGLMGIGSRRVMGIGLALLSRFDKDEVRGVIAHEFGHFDGGDTKLGPWVYKTRAAMGRTVTNLYKTAERLGEIADVMGIVLVVVAAPFRWMAVGYLRLAQAVSRQQEYAADALAARIVGTGPLLSGFSKLAGVAEATDAFLDQEMGPLVKLRLAPPFFSGLQSFTEKHKAVLEQIDQDSLKIGEVDPYDSHPPLSARIEALRALAPPAPLLEPHGDAQSAASLLVDAEALARAVLEFLSENKLEAVTWEDTGPHLITAQRERLAPYLGWLRGRDVEALRWDRGVHHALIARHPQASQVLDQLSDEVVQDIAHSVFTQALNVALSDAGYTARSAPGEPIFMVRGDQSINVSEQVKRLRDGELTEEAWSAFWTAAGIGDSPWGTSEAKPAARRKRARA